VTRLDRQPMFSIEKDAKKRALAPWSPNTARRSWCLVKASISVLVNYPSCALTLAPFSSSSLNHLVMTLSRSRLQYVAIPSSLRIGVRSLLDRLDNLVVVIRRSRLHRIVLPFSAHVDVPPLSSSSQPLLSAEAASSALPSSPS
jgi:hypothetical protein